MQGVEARQVQWGGKRLSLGAPDDGDGQAGLKPHSEAEKGRKGKEKARGDDMSEDEFTQSQPFIAVPPLRKQRAAIGKNLILDEAEEEGLELPDDDEDDDEDDEDMMAT